MVVKCNRLLAPIVRINCHSANEDSDGRIPRAQKPEVTGRRDDSLQNIDKILLKNVFLNDILYL